MRLAIADPPYPPMFAERYDLADGSARIVSRSRSIRYYGGGKHSSDHHVDAAEWDDPARHRALLEQLLDEFDGWAIATTPDGLEAYRPIPAGARIMAWIKPNARPAQNRIWSTWEPVITYVPPARRSALANPDLGRVRDTLQATTPKSGFVGAKPAAWTRWILDALGYDHETDELVDLFPGSGAVSHEAAQTAIPLP